VTTVISLVSIIIGLVFLLVRSAYKNKHSKSLEKQIIDANKKAHDDAKAKYDNSGADDIVIALNDLMRK